MKTLTEKQVYNPAENFFLDPYERIEALRGMTETDDVTAYSTPALMALLDLARAKLTEEPIHLAASIGRLERSYRLDQDGHRNAITLVLETTGQLVDLLAHYATIWSEYNRRLRKET